MIPLSLENISVYKNPDDYFRSLSLPGAYRKIVIKPGDVGWKLYRYNDVNVELALSCLDKLQKKAEPSYEAGNILV